MDDDLLQRIESTLRALEARVDELAERDGLRELEFQSVLRTIDLREDYIAELERIPEEVVAPKDVHIRNLEAMIAHLKDDLVAAEREIASARNAIRTLLRALARRARSMLHRGLRRDGR